MLGLAEITGIARSLPRWTKRRLPVELVFLLNGLSYCSATEVERYVKLLSRARKEALVEREPGMLALVEKRR